jgi:hypothetical protein
MKRAWWERFSKQYLLASLPGFEAKGHLIIQLPAAPLLKAFLFESSGFSSEAFHPQVFVQPLYVPASYLTLTIGERFLGAWRAEPGEEAKLSTALLGAIQRWGIPFLESLDTPEKLARPPKSWNESTNCHVQRAIAYSLAYVGKRDLAVARLTELLNSMLSSPNKYPWENALIEELKQFSVLLSTDYAAAMKWLHLWEVETSRSLRLIS